MSMFQLTEYLLWKSLKHRNSPERLQVVKEEFLQPKDELLEGDLICRVCTNAADIPVTDRIDDTLIMSAIRTVANISINEGDYYPKYVCKACLEELKIAFQFKRKCETSDMMFRRSISSETVIATSTQPLVKHDFKLLLHQLKLRREATQNVPIKFDEPVSNDIVQDNFDQQEACSPVNSELSEIVTRSKKITHKKIKKKRTTKSKKNVNRRILKLLKTSKLNVNQIGMANVDRESIKKITKEKKLKEHKCKRCDVKFDTKEEMTEHKNQNSCIYHPCPLCGKLVLNLSQHKNIVHLRPNKYTCHQCGKVYYSSGALANHLQVHKETFEYSCDLCPYKGKRKSYLVCHMRVHTGEHRYLCSKCPAKFTNPSNLRKHQLMHIGKKFECTKCKKLFRQQKIMQEHYDSAHLNIRYRCSICGRDLSTRKKLLSHELRVHKREKHKLFQELQKVVINNENE